MSESSGLFPVSPDASMKNEAVTNACRSIMLIEVKEISQNLIVLDCSIQSPILNLLDPLAMLVNGRLIVGLFLLVLASCLSRDEKRGRVLTPSKIFGCFGHGALEHNDAEEGGCLALGALGVGRKRSFASLYAFDESDRL